MKSEGLTTIPGGQGGRGVVPDDLLQQVLEDFSTKQDQTKAFLKNVAALQTRLRKADPAQWEQYSIRIHRDGSCATRPTPPSSCQRETPCP